MDYDVIYLGSGHACNHGGMLLAMSGKKVAFVEADRMGGTCTNYGCDAKILLDGPFAFMDGLQRYEGLCVESDIRLDWKKLMDYKRQTISVFDPILEGAFRQLGVDVLRGRGFLEDAHTVRVGGKTYTAEYIVLGTGQRSAELDIAGRELTRDSKDFMELDALPEHMICIGAGIIAMEFASMLLTVGKKVTVLVRGDKVLRAYPQDYVARLIAKMERQGAEFRYHESPASVEKTDAGYRVTTRSGLIVEGDYVLNAAGRVANVEDLGLEALGIKASSRGIEVDDHLRTAVPNIYATGDVVAKRVPKLTPTAEFESNYVACQILGVSDAPICYPPVPNLVFTLPRIGQVGVNVDEAKKHPEQYKVVENDWGRVNDWVASHETDAHLTLVFDQDEYLVGAAAYSSEAGTWLDYLTPIIDKRMTARDLSGMIMSFPTQTYMLWSILQQSLRRA